MEPFDCRSTVEWLKPSLPGHNRRRSLTLLLRMALVEAQPELFLGALGLALLAGLVSAWLSMPMVSTFCAAPLPLFLLYFRYFWRSNARMRELEKTFRFSFRQMCFARFAVLSTGAAAALLVLVITVSLREGADFLRLALCGASSAALLGGALLLLSLQERIGGLSLVGGALWLGMCIPMVGMPRMETYLLTLPLWAWLIPILLGLIMIAMGAKGGDMYVRAKG